VQAFDAAKTAATEKKAALDTVTKEFETLKKESSKIKSNEVDILAQLESFETQIKEGSSRMRYWADEIDKLHDDEQQDEQYDLSDDEGDDDEEKKAEGDDKKEAEPTEDKMDVDTEEKEKEVDETTEKPKFYSRTHSKTLPQLTKNALLQFDRGDLKFEITALEKERDR